MKRRFGVLIFVLSVWSLTTLVAQTLPNLTYQEAIKIALKNSYLLNQQKNNLELNQMQRLSNYAGLGPTVGASLGATQISGNTFNQNTGQVVNGLFDQVSGSVNANINLFNCSFGFSKSVCVNNVLSLSSVTSACSVLNSAAFDNES